MSHAYQLVLEGENDGAGVLRRVPDDREQDDADEAHRQAPRVRGSLDGAYDVLGQDGNDHGHEDQPEERAPEPERRLLLGEPSIVVTIDLRTPPINQLVH